MKPDKEKYPGRRVIEQNLSGDKCQALKKAIWTWEEDEVAYVCCITNSILKVRFTGRHWLSGNKWQWNKIYQFEILSSSRKDVYLTDEISHANEIRIFDTIEGATNHVINRINKRILRDTKGHEEKKALARAFLKSEKKAQGA